MNGSIFQSFPKFKPKLGDYVQIWKKKLSDWYMNGIGRPICIMHEFTFKFGGGTSLATKTKLEYPHWDLLMTIDFKSASETQI